jgi:CRISPR-associated protein Cmr5
MQTVQTMQQQRAAFALKAVQAAAESKDVQPGEFKSHASGLPAMIHMNGLGQAAAFFCSKPGESPAYGRLYRILSDWLCGEGQPFASHDDLLEGITASDMDAYLLAQAEAQMLMDWVKKFAKAFMAEEGDER